MTQSLRIEAWARLLRVSEALRNQVEAELKSAGFPPVDWYNALLELAAAGEGGLRPYALRERILLPQYTLSRLIDRLEGAGLVERRPCPQDGRGQIVSITDQGLELLDDMWPVYRETILGRVGTELTDREMKTLRDVLAKLMPGEEIRLGT